MKSVKTRWIFTIAFIVLCLLSILLPFTYDSFFHSENEKLTMIVILVTGIAAVLTFLIAVLLYEKFGIEKVLQERSTLMVIDILNFLKSNTILVHTSTATFPINLFSPFPP